MKKFIININRLTYNAVRREGAGNHLLAVFFGALFTLSFAPFTVFFAGLVSLSWLFLVVVNVKSIRHIFFIGWWFGFGHHVSGLYWISNSLLVEADNFAWMIPFAISVIPAFLAIYVALTCGFVGLINKLFKPSKTILWIIFACIWTLLEFLRTYLFTGFPWNLAGYIWTNSLEVMQLVNITSVFGLSFLAVLVCSVLGLLIRPDSPHRCFVPTHIFKPVFAVIILVASVYIFGILRLPDDTEYTEQALLLIQPNIPQKEIVDPMYVNQQFQLHVALTQANAKAGDIIIWPETSIRFPLHMFNKIKADIAEIIPNNAILIANTIRAVKTENGNKYWNTLVVLDDNGEVIAIYDKHHLVPFGEYVPLRDMIPFVEKITEGGFNFSAGSKPKPVALPGKPAFLAGICYEGIFPDLAYAQGNYSWLVNLTNDGWFGDSSGPYQHFQMTRMRAIEQGKPMIRVANTGISGVIDSYGRVVEHADLNKQKVIRVKLPKDIKK